MELFNKTALFPYPDLFVFLDRACPECGAPLSYKRVGGKEYAVCTNGNCSFYQEVEGGTTPQGQTQ
jgi:hypothetical protein